MKWSVCVNIVWVLRRTQCGFLKFCVFSVTRLCPTLRPHGLQPARLLRPWDFPGKSTGVCCHFLLQGIFTTQGSNPRLSYWQADFYHCVTWVYMLPWIHILTFYLFESWFLKNSVWECFGHCFIHFLDYDSIRLMYAIWFCVSSSLCLFFACPLAFLHSSYFLPSAGNSFNWVFYLSALSPHSSVLANSFFCSALKWICVFIIAVDCNIWKELRKNIQMVLGVCCSVVSVQGRTGETVRASPAGLSCCCSPSSPLLVVPSLGFFFFFFGIVNKGALRLLPPSEVWLLPTFFSTLLPLSWVDRSSGLLCCLLAWATFSSLIEPFLIFHFLNSPKTKLSTVNGTHSGCQELPKLLLDVQPQEL